MAAKRRRKGQFATVILSLLIVIVLTLLIVGICVLSYTISFVNGDVAIPLDAYKNSQDQTSIVYAYDASGDAYEIARLHGEENRIWVSLSDIPEDVQNAFICLEDKRFYSHPGIDYLRTVKAVLTMGKAGGGSTITQQLIKNLTDEKQATVARKFNEILYALNLEKNFDKAEILEAYLNTIPLGSGCYGVQTASQKYFGKDISEINAAEAAVMASITKAPTKYNPLLNPDNNKRRQLLCLDYMREQGKLTKEEYEEAKNYDLIFTNDERFVAPKETSKTLKQETKINSYYVDYVITSVINDLKSQYGYTQSEAYRMIYYGGLKIYCAVDENIQSQVEEIYVNRQGGFPDEPNRTEDGSNGTKKKVQSGITIMNYEGRIVAMVGGAGKKTINRGLNRAVDAVRSPGSSIKPLSVYGPGIDKNYFNYSSKLLNYGIIVNGQRWPRNFSGSLGAEDSYIILKDAVAQSLNTTSAQALKRLGLDTSFEYVTKKFHLSTLIADGNNTDKNFSSLAVGGMSKGVNTLEMCAAYCTFGNGGKYYKPYCYYKVTDFSGNTILESTPAPEQAIGEDTATIMNKVLQAVTQAGGTGYGKGVSGFTTYMKTGTTSDTKDKWCCGGTPYYCAAVWYGYDKQETMSVGGQNPAANIWSAVMNKIHTGLESKDFNFSGAVASRSYCRETGLLAGPDCTSTGEGWYKTSRLPDVCDGSEHAANKAKEAEEEG